MSETTAPTPAAAPDAGDAGGLTEEERAYLAAGHAYREARYRAFALARVGDRAAYERRSREVDRLSREMLRAVLALGPRHPTDRDKG